MTDENTRTKASIGLQGGSDDKTHFQSKKIQIRLKSGKIYGPYTRGQVLAFIESRRLNGEEHILYDGESQWKPITSDLEFFDLFQAILMGKKGTKEKVKRAGFPGSAAEQFGQDEQNAEPVISEKESVAQPFASTEGSRPKETIELAPSHLSSPVSAAPPQKKPKNKKLPLYLAAAAALTVALVLNKGPSSQAPQAFASISEINLAAKLNYIKPLNFVLGGLSLKIPSMPEQLVAEEDWNLPAGFGAAFWVADIQSLNAVSDPREQNKVSYWGRWAWDSLWLGATIAAVDSSLGEKIQKSGQDVFQALLDKKVVSEEHKKLFASLPLLFEGRWNEAAKLLGEASPKIEIATWLKEQALWMELWAKGGRGVSLPAQTEFDGTALQLSSQLRREIAAKQRQALLLAQQMAEEDPLNFELWFNMAQYYWRVSGAEIQLANRLFVTGAATLSLLPASYQRVYWSQFAEFLGVFGRKSSEDQALVNVSLLKDGNLIRSQDKFWDLQKEGLASSQIGDEIYARAQMMDLQPLDVAALRVIGPVSGTQGVLYLIQAAEHLAFQKDWLRAAKLFEFVTRLDKKQAAAWGGLVWAESNLFHFDKALRAQKEIARVSSETPESLKYMGVLLTAGREYEEAKKQFEDYLAKVPNDGWGHYFKAVLEEKNEKSLECLKAANLGRIHGKGEVKLRSELLFFRCRVLSKVGLKEALSQLGEWKSKQPSNIPLLLEWIDAQANADLMDQALMSAKEAVMAFPRSYDLRIKLAEVYERRQEYDLALGFYNDAKKDRPESGEALVRIARIFEKQEKHLLAAQNYETAAQIDPSYPDVWLYAARAYDKAGKTQDAARAYVREIEERPAVLQNFVDAAEYMLKINAPHAVPKIFQKFTSDYQDDPRVLTRLAQAYLAMGETASARDRATMALRSDPNIAEANRIMGIIYDQQGQYEMAKRHFESYLRLLPQAVDADAIRSRISMPHYSN